MTDFLINSLFSTAYTVPYIYISNNKLQYIRRNLKQIDEFLSSSRNEKISNLDNPNLITNSKTNYNNQTISKASLYKFEEEFSPAQTEESNRDRIIQEENEEYEHT